MRGARQRLERIEEALSRVDRSIDRIEVATIVREPNLGLAAEAYEGLRRQVVAAAAERTAHLAQLAQLAEAVRTQRTNDLPGLVEDWMLQSGLERRRDPHDDRYVDVLGTPATEGEPRTLLRPAYVDAVTGRPIMMGQAEQTTGLIEGAQA